MAESALKSLNPLSYRKSPQHSRLLLKDFSGTVAAGEMLLVIGKPGSGCTTFLKSLANMREEYKETSGSVSYGGRSAKHMAEKEAAEIAFCGVFGLGHRALQKSGYSHVSQVRMTNIFQL